MNVKELLYNYHIQKTSQEKPSYSLILPFDRKLVNKKKYNLKGSVMSYFLQEYECQILECMYNYCVKNKPLQKYH